MSWLWPMLRPHWRRELEVLAYMLVGLAYSLAVSHLAHPLFQTLA